MASTGGPGPESIGSRRDCGEKTATIFFFTMCVHPTGIPCAEYSLSPGDYPGPHGKSGTLRPGQAGRATHNRQHRSAAATGKKKRTHKYQNNGKNQAWSATLQSAGLSRVLAPLRCGLAIQGFTAKTGLPPGWELRMVGCQVWRLDFQILSIVILLKRTEKTAKLQTKVN